MAGFGKRESILLSFILMFLGVSYALGEPKKESYDKKGGPLSKTSTVSSAYGNKEPNEEKEQKEYASTEEKKGSHKGKKRTFR